MPTGRNIDILKVPNPCHPFTVLQEIVYNYAANLVHRPDMSLLHYGFVLVQEKPLLCAVDLPHGYAAESQDDSLYEGA